MKKLTALFLCLALLTLLASAIGFETPDGSAEMPLAAEADLLADASPIVYAVNDGSGTVNNATCWTGGISASSGFMPVDLGSIKDISIGGLGNKNITNKKVLFVRVKLGSIAPSALSFRVHLNDESGNNAYKFVSVQNMTVYNGAPDDLGYSWLYGTIPDYPIPTACALQFEILAGSSASGTATFNYFGFIDTTANAEAYIASKYVAPAAPSVFTADGHDGSTRVNYAVGTASASGSVINVTPSASDHATLGFADKAGSTSYHGAVIRTKVNGSTEGYSFKYIYSADGGASQIRTANLTAYNGGAADIDGYVWLYGTFVDGNVNANSTVVSQQGQIYGPVGGSLAIEKIVVLSDPAAYVGTNYVPVPDPLVIAFNGRSGAASQTYVVNASVSGGELVVPFADNQNAIVGVSDSNVYKTYHGAVVRVKKADGIPSGVKLMYLYGRDGGSSSYTLTASLTPYSDEPDVDGYYMLCGSFDYTIDYTSYGKSQQFQFSGTSAAAMNVESIVLVDDVAAYAAAHFTPLEKSPLSFNVCSIRTTGKPGLRFAGYVNEKQREAADEYGFITAVSSDTLAAHPEYLVFNSANEASATNENDVKYTSGVCYNAADGTDMLYATNGAFLGEDALDGYFFTGVLVGIPSSYYNTAFAARPYVRIDGVNFYGECVAKSLHDVALSVKDSDYYNTLDEAGKAYIDACIGR